MNSRLPRGAIDQACSVVRYLFDTFLCRERPPWRSGKRAAASFADSRNATQGVPYRIHAARPSNDIGSTRVGRRGRRARHSRAGYSLVELLTVISINSVLMAIAAGLLGTLLQSQRQGERHCERTGGLVRLTEQFRSDVAAARDAELAGETLRLALSDEQSCEFLRDGERLRRVEYRGDQVVRREAYRLADLTEAKFVVDEPKAVSLRLRFSDAPRGIGEAWRVDAHLGKDRRFEEERAP